MALLTLCVCHPAGAQDGRVPDGMTLSDIWRRADEYNKQLRIQQLKVQHSYAQVEIATEARLPEIKAEGLYARVSNLAIYEAGLLKTPSQYPVVHTFYKAGADATLAIYRGGSINRNIRIKKTAAHLAEERQHLTAAEVHYTAALHYLDIYRSRRYRSLVLQDIAERERQLQEIRQLHQNGVVLKSDLLRAELKLSQQRMSLLEIENSIRIAMQQLSIMIGLPDSTDLHVAEDTTLVQPMPVSSYETCLEAAHQHSFAFKISGYETALSALALGEVKAGILPVIQFFAEYAYTYPQIQFYPYSVAPYGLGQTGVKASVPISAFYHNKRKVQAASIAHAEAEVVHADMEDHIREEVYTAYLRYTEALTRIGVARENIVQAQENYRIVRHTYFNQLSLLTDLLDAETQLLSSQFDLTTAQVAARVRYYQLQKAIGNL
ncbi:TolC family protein [Chitinophaga pendula]|uniref:TolC family protein n=1 Tax=Chitinophaga TaxID=79328 RepID=UPI0018E04002|nr:MULTISPECIES: TolC family protein [Chitinophaga]UCJ09370.1 TolC family protein [Chitinophaga pendula]